MEIKKKTENGACTLAVEGRIDTKTAPEFTQVLLQAIEEAQEIFIDLNDVVYVSSAGLRAFLNGQKKANKTKKSMILRNVSEEVMEVFEMTGFASDILEIE